jgi:hypothetical protein
MLDALLNILEDASAALPPRPAACFTLAGDRFAIRGEPELVAQMTPALQTRLVPCDGAPGLEILLWSGALSPWELAPPQWQAAERWAAGVAVHAGGPEGMAFFDPLGGIVALYDARSNRAGMWFANPAAPALWIVAAPFLRLLDVWFVLRGSIMCHGAAIAHRGRAALIVGPGGAGKSSLALRAPEHGFSYLGDDYVLLEPGRAGATIHSVYGSGKLAGHDLAAGLPVCSAVHRAPDEWAEKSFLRIDEASILASAPLALILEPRVGGGDTPWAEPISPAEALRAVLPSTLHQMAGHQQEKLIILTRGLAAPRLRLHLSPSHSRNLAFIAQQLEAQALVGAAA